MKSKIVSGLLVLALSAGILLTGFAGTARAQEPPDIEDTYTIDGVTYYNVNSANFNSYKKFYEDVFRKRHSSLYDLSMGDMWMLTALGVAMGEAFVSGRNMEVDALDRAKLDLLWAQYEAYYNNETYYHNEYEYTAPKWHNDGYVATTLHFKFNKVDLTIRSALLGLRSRRDPAGKRGALRLDVH